MFSDLSRRAPSLNPVYEVLSVLALLLVATS